MRRGFYAWLLFVCALAIEAGQAATREVDRSLQCLVVLTDNWRSTAGVMHTFERSGPAKGWKVEGVAIPVVVGKNGLGAGKGLIRLDFDGAPEKKEGDDKAPAGIFRLASAFGYAPTEASRWIKLPYLALSKQIEGIDDPRSRYYNKLVDRSKVAKVDWRSSERMRRDDILYKWGVVVGHNWSALPGAGSCIFLHIWKSPTTPTTGCTAMSEQNLMRLLRWLDPAQRPILVQMPKAAYRLIRARHDLPDAFQVLP